MTQLNKIEGVFTLTTPLHCASTDESLVSDGAKTETPTMQRKIATTDGIQRLPYFPGNDLRGRLRRKAANLLLDQITAKGKVKVALYQGLNCASITGQPDTADLSVEEALRARENPYMGLFGGGARLLRSRYRANDLTPIIADTIAIGAVPAAFGETSDVGYTLQDDSGKAAKGYQLVEKVTVLRVDDVMRVLRPDELEKYVEDATATIRAKQLAVMDERRQRKSDKAAEEAGTLKKAEITKKSTVENIMSYQAIVAGTPMYFLLDFADDCTDAHIGLMLMALRDLVREQALGGWVRSGLGRFTTNLTLTRNGQSMRVFDGEKAGGDAKLSPDVQILVDAATIAMGTLTAEDMMAFFLPRESAAAEKAPKAKKSEAEAA